MLFNLLTCAGVSMVIVFDIDIAFVEKTLDAPLMFQSFIPLCYAGGRSAPGLRLGGGVIASASGMEFISVSQILQE